MALAQIIQTQIKMPIHTECVDFIVPIAVIREKYPGGWERCLKDHLPFITGGTVWFDDELFRSGAMGPVDGIVEHWQRMGFNTISVRDDTGSAKYWDDVCVHERMSGGATLPCDWLGHCQSSGAVFYRDCEAGQLMEKEGAEVVYPYSPSIIKVCEEVRAREWRRSTQGYVAVALGSVALLTAWVWLHPDPNYWLMAFSVAILMALAIHHY